VCSERGDMIEKLQEQMKRMESDIEFSRERIYWLEVRILELAIERNIWRKRAERAEESFNILANRNLVRKSTTTY